MGHPYIDIEDITRLMLMPLSILIQFVEDGALWHEIMMAIFWKVEQGI
jgi:hypothetical protein